MNSNYFSDSQREFFDLFSEEEFYFLVDKFNEKAVKAIDEWAGQAPDNDNIVKEYFELSEDEVFSELSFETEVLFDFLNEYDIDVPSPYAIYIFYGNSRYDELAESWGEREFISKLSELEKSDPTQGQVSYVIARGFGEVIAEGYFDSAIIARIKSKVQDTISHIEKIHDSENKEKENLQ